MEVPAREVSKQGYWNINQEQAIELWEPQWVAHFTEKDCSADELEFCILFKCNPKPFNTSDALEVLLCKEAYYISKFQSLILFSLNLTMDHSPYI